MQLLDTFVGVMLLGFSCAPAYSQAIDPYANDPEWYRPGHPLKPAEPGSIRAPEGFRVTKVIAIPNEIGSIASMATDARGDLIVAMQHKPGIFRVPIASVGAEQGAVLKPLGGEAANIGHSHGLLWAFDSLYVTVSEKNDQKAPGLYRLLDTNSDSVFDRTEVLFEFNGAGEHGPHGLVVGPDNDSLYMICGNGTPVPERISKRRMLSYEGIDHLMPTGFQSSEYTDAGFVVRFKPNGDEPELFASGLRNSYDLAFNEAGDLFTYDSDMEYDLGTPWYRPTRICHLASGSHFGWRSQAAKWPEWYEDSSAPVVNVGPGSPTGLIFGYETRFPEKYRKALFALDWTFATIYAVHLDENGAGYLGRVEPFVSALGLPLTDVTIGGDGALYFSVGGRRLGSAIYRVSYDGSSEAVSPVERTEESVTNRGREIRLALEVHHGNPNPKELDFIWAHLESPDKSIRYAARVALEWLPEDSWKARALAETNEARQFTALLALAKVGGTEALGSILRKLNGKRLPDLSEERLLLALRIYELALARGQDALSGEYVETATSLSLGFPGRCVRANRELARLLCYLGHRPAIEPILTLIEEAASDRSAQWSELIDRNLRYASPLLAMAESPPMVERMHFAQMLNWIADGWSLEERRRYLFLVVEAMQSSKGGNGYLPGWHQILDTARSSLSGEETSQLAWIWEPLDTVEPLPEAEGPGRIWELDYLTDRIQEGLIGADFENGKRMYAAASCVTCHSIGGNGGSAGPDLSTIGQRFTARDLLDSIIHPSRSISDQYQVMVIELRSGETVTGRIVSKDSRATVVATNALDRGKTQSILNSEIVSLNPLPASTMPPGLLNTLNEREVMDLMAFLLSGGNENHGIYETKF